SLIVPVWSSDNPLPFFNVLYVCLFLANWPSTFRNTPCSPVMRPARLGSKCRLGYLGTCVCVCASVHQSHLPDDTREEDG
ncbi:hypothetical protein CH063_13771, partial [Colletotrichum higginsianum]